MTRTVRIYTDIDVETVEEEEGYQEILDKALERLKDMNGEGSVEWKGEVLFTEEEYTQMLEGIAEQDDLSNAENTNSRH